MKGLTATARGVVAAFVAVALTLPATAAASDGGMSSNQGGGATYGSAPAAEISLAVASGAWLGRATRIRGRSVQLAGRTVAIERRRPHRRGWVPVASVRADQDGRFRTKWTPTSAGRHRLRAVPGSASSAGTSSDGETSKVKRVTVFQEVTSTWYGPGFYGNRTACGQRLTTTILGVAHRTLPCGTEVALRANGRTLVVPVIDRGPYARGVSYDLTRETADRLGVMHTAQIGAAILSR